MTQEEHPVHHSACHVIFYSYSKTHKSRLKYEIKYGLYKIAQKINNLKFGLLRFFGS